MCVMLHRGRERERCYVWNDLESIWTRVGYGVDYLRILGIMFGYKI